MKYTRIQSFNHLTELIAAGKTEFITVHGFLRCSRSIRRVGDQYEVFSYVDGSTSLLTPAELEDMFADAISHRAMAAEE